MTRGCQKRIIHIKETDSAMFEEAYFVLKSGLGETRISGDEQMLKEANRIIKESLNFTYPSKSRKNETFMKPFAVGAVLSALVCTIAALLIFLL